MTGKARKTIVVVAMAITAFGTEGQLAAQTKTESSTQQENPALQATDDYPLMAKQWEELTEEGKLVAAGAMIDGMRLSPMFVNCPTIEPASMKAGIDEWMKVGDRSEAIMTIAAYIAYGVCIKPESDTETKQTTQSN